MVMNEEPKERRKHLRIYRNFILTYHVKGQSEDFHDVSQVNNVSKGGVSFSTTLPLKEGTIILVSLKAPFIAESVRFEGVVLECREKVAGMIYEIRLQFQEIPQQALALFKKIESYNNFKDD